MSRGRHYGEQSRAARELLMRKSVASVSATLSQPAELQAAAEDRRVLHVLRDVGLCIQAWEEPAKGGDAVHKFDLRHSSRGEVGA